MVARGEGILRDFGKVMYTLPHLKWITNKILLNSTWNSVQCYVAAWMGVEFGGEWIHVYVWLSPFTLYYNIANWLYTPIQHKKFDMFKKNYKTTMLH